MAVEQLKERYIDLTWDLFREEFVDEYFKQLQMLQENQPQFVFDITSLYFVETEKLLIEIGKMLDEDPVDFDNVEESLVKMKGSTSSVGFRRVCIVCEAMYKCCMERNQERCAGLLQQLKEELSLVKSKLEFLFKLEQQIVEAGGSIPSVKRS